MSADSNGRSCPNVKIFIHTGKALTRTVIRD